MALAMKKRRLLIVAACVLAVIVLVLATMDYFFVVYGPANARHSVLQDWTNKRSSLNRLQTHLVIRLLYDDVEDPDAEGDALAVLISHLEDNEAEIIRHLAYVALSSRESRDRALALRGLGFGSEIHADIALSVFLYKLKFGEFGESDGVAELAACINGVDQFEFVEGLPTIEGFSNYPETNVAHLAETVADRLRALKGSSNQLQTQQHR